MFKDQTRSTFFRHKFKQCYPISRMSLKISLHQKSLKLHTRFLTLSFQLTEQLNGTVQAEFNWSFLKDASSANHRSPVHNACFLVSLCDSLVWFLGHDYRSTSVFSTIILRLSKCQNSILGFQNLCIALYLREAGKKCLWSLLLGSVLFHLAFHRSSLYGLFKLGQGNLFGCGRNLQFRLFSVENFCSKILSSLLPSKQQCNNNGYK